jgi:murein endopeptidase
LVWIEFPCPTTSTLPVVGVGTTGHASHQVGLDRKDVDPKLWTRGHFGIIKAAAQDPLVQRIFVNAAIKKACAARPETIAPGSRKLRPWWGTTTTFTSACTAA